MQNNKDNNNHGDFFHIPFCRNLIIYFNLISRCWKAFFSIFLSLIALWCWNQRDLGLKLDRSFRFDLRGCMWMTISSFKFWYDTMKWTSLLKSPLEFSFNPRSLCLITICSIKEPNEWMFVVSIRTLFLLNASHLRKGKSKGII